MLSPTIFTFFHVCRGPPPTLGDEDAQGGVEKEPLLSEG